MRVFGVQVKLAHTVLCVLSKVRKPPWLRKRWRIDWDGQVELDPCLLISIDESSDLKEGLYRCHLVVPHVDLAVVAEKPPLAEIKSWPPLLKSHPS